LGSRKSTTARKAADAGQPAKTQKGDTVRDEVRRLVEQLPEEKLEFARRYLEHLRQESDDDEVLTPEERAHIDEGLADLAAGRVIPHEDVKREFGW
jgi:predicted transcriptional regulator